MSRVASLDEPEVARWQRWSLGAGLAALIVCLLGAILVDAAAFFRAYLAAYMFFLGVSLGSLAILLIHHATGGAWGFLIRRILEAQIKVIPLMAILFIPIAIGVRSLYLWAQPDMVAADERLQYQQFYLNPTYYYVRAVIYFLIWLWVAYLLSAWSRREDASGDVRWALKAERFAGFGLLLYGVTLHFSAFDWIQSLQT